MSKEVDIIVCYWSSDFMIKKCINKILETDYDNFRICIVDNTRKSKKKLTSYFNSEKVRVIKGADPLFKGKRKQGYRRGRQHPDGLEIGLSETSSEYIALFHPDSWPIDNSWLDKCFNYISGENIKMVGIQHESSIHSSFQFFNRDIITDLNYHFNGEKKDFGVTKDKESLNKYIKYPKAVKPARTKWAWGEDLAIKIYSKGWNTIGFNPTKGFIPKKLVDRHEIDCVWRSFGQDGYGCVYGDMFFHIWKTFAKEEKGGKVSEYKKCYKKDDYLRSYYVPTNNDYDNIVVNESIHDNYVYDISNNFVYIEK
jgi:hypothetical protein